MEVTFAKIRNDIKYDPINDVFFGTVVRAAPISRGGNVFRLDWPSKHIVTSRVVIPRNPSTEIDTNPRGNSRGCRGIALTEYGVIIANYHTIEVADSNLNIQRTLSDPLFVGLHEIFLDEIDHLWVAATAIDGAHCLRLSDGKVLERRWPRDMANVRAALTVDQSSIDVTLDQRLNFLGNSENEKSHLHLNAIARIGGRLMALFNSFGAICDLDSGSVIIRDARLVGAHNLVSLSEMRCLVNDTRSAAILEIDLDRGVILQTVELKDFAPVREIEAGALDEAQRLRLEVGANNIAQPLFVRGLSVAGDTILVGLSPATILRIDLRAGTLVEAWTLTLDPRVCVHGLVAPLPSAHRSSGPMSHQKRFD